MATQTRRPPPAEWHPPVGIAVGAGLGLLAGILVGRTALGLAVGAAFGLVGGATTALARDVPGPRRRPLLTGAVMLLAGGAIAVLVVLSG